MDWYVYTCILQGSSKNIQLIYVKTVFSLLNHFYNPAATQIEKSSTDDNVYNKIIADFNPSTSWRQGGFEQFKNGSMCDSPLLLRELQPYAKFVVLLGEPINQ